MNETQEVSNLEDTNKKVLATLIAKGISVSCLGKMEIQDTETGKIVDTLIITATEKVQAGVY